MANKHIKPVNFKVTVYGGTNNKEYTKQEITECEKLGTWLGRNKIEILTGACKGMPYYTGRAAVLAGGKVTGFTPAKNQKEHVEKYDFPLDGVSDLVFNKTRYYTMAENFLRRSWDMTPFSDVVIALGGSWGTYSELIFSFFAKKIIILIENFGGAVEAFKNTHAFFGAREVNPAVHNGSIIISVPDVAQAIDVIRKYREKTDPLHAPL
jgi:predicted Rossmann-fold nucleotide-binding protein